MRGWLWISRNIFPLACALAMACAACKGAIDTDYGVSATYWDTHAVVVGRVRGATDVKPLEDGRYGHEVIIAVDATIATDLLVPTSLRLRYETTILNSAIADFKPKPGDAYALCIERRDTGWFILASRVDFFPSGAGVQPVRSLEDPVLSDLRALVRRVRIKSQNRKYG